MPSQKSTDFETEKMSVLRGNLQALWYIVYIYRILCIFIAYCVYSAHIVYIYCILCISIFLLHANDIDLIKLLDFPDFNCGIPRLSFGFMVMI